MSPHQLLKMLVLLAIAATSSARKGHGPGEQDWGFVDIRENAHMFYWLYYTTANVAHYTERPLVIWLQGGPGGSSAGYGNFEEIGPLNVDGNYRNWTLVKDLNVLFIDNPVGSGFSYVDEISFLAFNNTEIALDLVEFMKGFYKKHPEFVTVPTHIFCESYGGKMAAEFALKLLYATKRQEIRSNLRSLVMGDPWISPIDTVLSWAPYLFNMGIVDEEGSKIIAAAASEIRNVLNSGEWIEATNAMFQLTETIKRLTLGVNFYNILRLTSSAAHMLLKKNNQPDRTLANYNSVVDSDKKLETLMRGPVSVSLGIPSHIQWGDQSDYVIQILYADIMLPAFRIVSKLLSETDLKIGVYSGQLDLICSTPGTLKWVKKLQWPYRSEYVKAPRLGINIDDILEGYEKSGGNFSMFWINRSGHMVSVDNPAGFSYIVKKFTNYG